MQLQRKPDRTKIDCSNCNRTFTTAQAFQVEIKESGTACMCPQCKKISAAPFPTHKIDRPPQIDKTEHECNMLGLRTAKIFFEGGGRLEFKDTVRGWVKEEMYDTSFENDECIDSFRVELRKEACRAPKDYLKDFEESWPKYTVLGARIEQPHIAAGILNKD
ncbi:hypothetical protein ACFQL7_20775 [Halocatena marina]|uniref:Uncharacterized protein n=1 Tax=Halocatena marina TaxID=2934937 RepID=A0ABD5YRZ0_9EURY|nr:hypothetical protein [Halocatena marina]